MVFIIITCGEQIYLFIFCAFGDWQCRLDQDLRFLLKAAFTRVHSLELVTHIICQCANSEQMLVWLIKFTELPQQWSFKKKLYSVGKSKKILESVTKNNNKYVSTNIDNTIFLIGLIAPCGYCSVLYEFYWLLLYSRQEWPEVALLLALKVKEQTLIYVKTQTIFNTLVGLRKKNRLSIF